MQKLIIMVGFCWVLWVPDFYTPTQWIQTSMATEKACRERRETLVIASAIFEQWTEHERWVKAQCLPDGRQP